MDERALTERLITYDTSTLEGMQSAAGFVKGWLEARDVEVDGHDAQRPPRAGRHRRAPRGGPTVVLHGHLDVVPGPPGAVRPARGRRPPLRPRRLRHEGRPGGDDGAPSATWPEQERRARALRLRLRRGVRGGRRSAAPTTSSSRATSATSRSPASPPTCTSACRPRACSRMRIEVTGTAGARLHPVAGRQRGAQGDRRVPPDRVAAVRARVVRPLRPALDQPRPDHRRRRAQQGARPVRDRRRRALPAGPGPGGDPRRVERAPGRRRSSKVFHRAPGDRRARQPVRAGAGRGDRRAWRRARSGSRSAATAPRTRSRFLEAGVPGGGVRPGRRRPPRPRGVGVDPRRSAQLSPGARGVREAAARAGSRTTTTAGCGSPDARGRSRAPVSGSAS